MTDPMRALVILFTLIGGVVGFEYHYAKDSDLVLVQLRLDQKIKADERYQTQQRLWQLEDRNQAQNCDEYQNEADKAECRLLKLRLEILNQELRSRGKMSQ